MMLNKIIELMQLQFDGRTFPQILIDWECKLYDIIQYEYSSIGDHLNRLGLLIELKESQSTDEEGYSCYVIKIDHESETVFIRLEAMSSSYEGIVFKNWHLVKPVEVTKIEYQRV